MGTNKIVFNLSPRTAIEKSIRGGDGLKKRIDHYSEIGALPDSVIFHPNSGLRHVIAQVEYNSGELGIFEREKKVSFHLPGNPFSETDNYKITFYGPEWNGDTVAVTRLQHRGTNHATSPIYFMNSTFEEFPEKIMALLQVWNLINRKVISFESTDLYNFLELGVFKTAEELSYCMKGIIKKTRLIKTKELDISPLEQVASNPEYKVKIDYCTKCENSVLSNY